MDLPTMLTLDPTTKDGIKNITSVCISIDALGYYLCYWAPGVVGLTVFSSAAILIVATILAIRLILFAADPLETYRGKWPPEPLFFQSHYPSLYLIDRCSKCTVRDLCGNRPLEYGARHHIPLWYDWFSSSSTSPEMRQRTYEKGFTCRFIFYFKYSLSIFSILGMVTLVIQGFLSSNPTPIRIFYIVVNGILALLISFTNKARVETPTGCWSMWRDINDRHIASMKRHESSLVELVCRRFEND